jgi:hypothetical protein
MPRIVTAPFSASLNVAMKATTTVVGVALRVVRDIVASPPAGVVADPLTIVS